MKGWTLKDGEWEISVAIVDERRLVRRLAMGAPAGGGKQAALATRKGTKVTHHDGRIRATRRSAPSVRNAGRR